MEDLSFDLGEQPVRALNQFLHGPPGTLAGVPLGIRLVAIARGCVAFLVVRRSAVAGVVAFAYLRISSGISSVGDFMGFVTALLMAAQPIRALGNLAGRVHEGLAAAESVYGIINEKADSK